MGQNLRSELEFDLRPYK